MYKVLGTDIFSGTLQKVLRMFTLENMLVSGCFFYLTGMFYAPGWSGYKNLLHVFLFLPGLIIFFRDADFRGSLKQSAEFKWFLAFLLFGMASVAWSEHAALAVELKRSLFILLFAIGISACEYRKPGSLRKLLILGVIVAAIYGSYVLYHYYIALNHAFDTRLQGIGLLDHPILSSFVYGIYLALGFAVIVYTPQQTSLKIALTLSLLVLMVVLLATQTRGAFVALLAYIVLALLLHKNKYALICTAAFIVCSLVILYFQSDMLLRGVSYRPQLWMAGLEIASESLLVGHGVGSEYQLQIGSVNYDHPHSLLIRIMMDTGLVGLSLWLILLSVIFIKVMQLDTREKHLAIGVLVYAFVTVLFDGDGPFVRPRAVWFVSWLPVVFSIAWLMAGRREGKAQPDYGQH